MVCFHGPRHPGAKWEVVEPGTAANVSALLMGVGKNLTMPFLYFRISCDKHFYGN